MPGPAYRIETPRLVLRCWNPADAPLLSQAITDSLEHLRPWMPWANAEPIALADRVAGLRRFRANFDADIDYVLGIFDRDEKRVLGGTGWHNRLGPGALEIGYWIAASETRKGLCTEAAGALTRVAFAVMGVERVEIHCDPRNVASAGVPRKLGYTLDATLRKRLHAPDGHHRDTMIWSMMKDELGASAANNVPVHAFDACGHRL